MFHRSKLPLLVLMAFVYIGIGDLIPGPVGKFSVSTRNQINNWIVGLVPDWNPKNPNRRTEEQLLKEQRQERSAL